MSTVRSPRALLLGLLLAALLASDAAAATAPTVTVMTRNLYLGGDIARPLNAIQGASGDAATFVAFANANYQLRSIVDRTDFPARSRLLAREIATRKPDLVGLQEVALWRRGPLQFDQIGVPNATKVDYDFLKLLLAGLKRAGTPYEAVAVQRESDAEGPVFAGSDPLAAGGDPASFDARITIRDVILRRRASRVKVVHRGGDHYKARIPIELGGRKYALIRGFNRIDAKLRGRRFRLVNTHLESDRSDIALAQAKEMVAGPAKPSRKRPTIIVCDCNSDPLNQTVKPYEISQHRAPYEFITGSGYADEWLRFAPAEAGFTSGFNELVDDPDTSSIDHRIDMVFGRRANGKPLRVVKGWIVGTDPANRTASGLWPSDHAGVVITLRL